VDHFNLRPAATRVRTNVRTLSLGKMEPPLDAESSIDPHSDLRGSLPWWDGPSFDLLLFGPESKARILTGLENSSLLQPIQGIW